MKTSKLILLASLAFMAADGFATEKRVAVVYFSKSGNTEKVAQEIAAETGGTLVQIFAVDEYPADKKANMERAKTEHESGALPQIAYEAADCADCDILFIGYPLWCAHVPAPVLSFLAENNPALAGKTLVPFVTYGGSPFARGTKDLRRFAPDTQFEKTIAVRASRVPKCAEQVRKKAWAAVESAE